MQDFCSPCQTDMRLSKNTSSVYGLQTYRMDGDLDL